MSINGFNLAQTQGTVGMGTNKQKAVFGNVRVEPIRLKKPEPAMDTEMLKELGSTDSSLAMSGVGLPNGGDEISPNMVVDVGSLPGAALGKNGGMAPKSEGVSQETKVVLQDVVKISSAEERKQFCGKHFPNTAQLKACESD